MEQYKDKNGKYSLNPETLFSNRIIYDTIKYQKKYGFEIGKNNSTWNNEADAFKHAYMQAALAIRGTQYLAKKLGDGHEQQGADRGQPSGERNMDLWNNFQGRKIAEQIMKEYGPMIKFYLPEQLGNIISEKVMEKMQNGELITRPDDKRKYEDLLKGQTTGYAVQVEPFTRQQIGRMTPDEFARNEALIMEQLRNGQIIDEADGFFSQTNDGEGCFGHDENGKYTIYDSYGHDDNAPQMFFTREDIGSMSSAEFAKNESAIMAQLKERGIPSRKDLPSGKKSYNHREKSNGSSKGSNSSDGKWVTINGNHVLIKN